MNKKGFTLIEIIVVIVILAILLAVAVPTVLNYIDSADDAKYMTQARNAATSLQTEITKEYLKGKSAPDSNDTYDQARELVIESLSDKKPVITDIYALKSKSLINLDSYLKYGESPELILCYYIYFEHDEKMAVMIPNGDIKIQNIN